ncbi:MAG: azoR [Pedosphaera sp.]|nr:azoR [Pedosphaera sp.]
MAKLLYIQSSPRGERSASNTVATQFLEVYRATHPEDTVEILDLWQRELPEFNGATLEAKYAILSGQPGTPAQFNAWKLVVSLIEHFKAADKYLVSLPMWNFGIPYKLKHYIDVLLQPGLTFSFTPAEGYKGLVTGKPAVVVYARGGAYGPGTGAEGYDKQSDYLRHILGFIGFTDVKQIFVEPTLAGPNAKEAAIEAVRQQTAELASGL